MSPVRTVRTAAWLLLLAVAVQGAEAALQDDPEPVRTAAGLRLELLYGPAFPGGGASDEARARSVPVAFGLSAAVPGLGQAYNRQWIKAALAAALEVGLIAGFLAYRERGLDAEAAYQAYAHAYWDPLRYARWLEDYSAWLPDAEPGTIHEPEGIDFRRPEDWTAEERTAVRQFFEEIRALENRLYYPQTGASFSHKLPYFAEQQYYELIGKYFQFAPGWADYPDWIEDGAYTQAIDPTLTGPGGTLVNVQGRIRDYARDHAHANDLLRQASRLSAFVLVNHLVAAIDAAVFAKLYNDRLSARVEISRRPGEALRPTATLQVKF